MYKNFKSILNSFLFLIYFFLSFALNAKTHTIKIYKYKFIPEKIEIKLGHTVKWINTEKRQYHSILFKGKINAESEYLFPKENWKLKFSAKGKFKYGCGPHEEMHGIILVK